MSPRLSLVAVVLALMLAVLGGRFAVHMLQLARQGGHGDFATLYTGAHLYRAGRGFYDAQPGREGFGVTENRDVLEMARRLGTLHSHETFEHVHVFSYPPFTVLPFVPFTAVPFRIAAAVWQVLSLGFLAFSLWCLWRVVPLSLEGGLLLVALALLYEPLENSLGLGQINLLILALTSAFIWALASGRPALAGVALGVATALRLHPGIFLLYLAWRRRWAAFAWGTGTAAACTALAVVVVGWPATLEYATVVGPKYARAFPGLGNFSLTGWVTTVGATVAPAVGVDTWRLAGRVLSVMTLVAAFGWLRPPGPAAPGRVIAEIGFLTVVLYLVVPSTTINHLVFLLIPLAVLLEHALCTRERGIVAGLAVALLFVGAIDDYYMHPRLNGGPQVLLGGIKTYGMVILALLAAVLARRAPQQARA